MPREKTPGNPTTRRHSDQEKQQAIRLVRQLRAELGSEQGTVGQVGIAVSEETQSAELFYWVVAAHRGRGVASSAVPLVCDWAIERGVERIFLVTHLDNEASQRVAARCGFTREGILRGYERFKSRRPDVMSWSLLANDPRPWQRP